VLAQHGLPVTRFAVLGWSMGGFGALLAATEAPETFVAVVANAPAMWLSYEKANPAAFASAEEWREWGDLLNRAEKLRGVRVRVDCGDSDEFAGAVAALRDRLPDPRAVWRSVAPEQLRFIGTALRQK
jgi:S-formylglutathione hydrolase FrmB